MFLDLKNYTPPPEPPAEPERPTLTPRQQKALAWIVALNIVLLFVAPIGGATVISGLIELFG
ncbi:MAG: hypothetical protein ACK4UW_16300 [Rhizobium rhizophilum]|uniref:Uncharacterized protein n=1 Tax=Rhizobium rhizophilum TaxID=1850373 RepID=A0ABY2QXQ0_9HYPH|nr:hypothetical protein [Rhizobium rhizophilum]MBX9466779.1 hypothetical protein [Rhizobium sp.]THV15718.1 hypothetical protein E9677_10265 [Rhizobium rhizophilum]